VHQRVVPADGHVVHLGYGCGSHSETGKDVVGSDVHVAENVVVDEVHVDYETVEAETQADEAEAPADNEQPAGGGHSAED
jgi:hypothetical protein